MERSVFSFLLCSLSAILFYSFGQEVSANTTEDSASLQISSSVNQDAKTRYIDKWSQLAVSEMYRSGVPASITLAQGILESSSGMSQLAVKSNNHFGIKCHNSWKGQKVYHDDDAKGECFRKYSHPSESYKDHSDFLRYSNRYRFLFDFQVTDYKSWAYGLKQAGYATDPAYPTKLIKIIEDYNLSRFDRMPASYSGAEPSDNASSAPAKSHVTPASRSSVIPPSPSVIDRVEPLTGKQRAVFSFALSREMYSRNGVPFVKSMEGETYASIATFYHLFPGEILKFNDAEDANAELDPGTVVYLKPKKAQAQKGLDKYVIEGDESLRDIAQHYAVKLRNLIKMNGLPKDYAPKAGDILKLRK